MTNKILSVRLHGKPCGILKQNAYGKLEFTYEATASSPLSVSLPLIKKEHDDKSCQAYFGGLLPEGEATRRVLAKRFGISPHNTFSLLAAIGGDCAGAVSLVDPGAPIMDDGAFSLKGKICTEAELARHIRELPQKPLFMAEGGLRLSLAGVQDKAPVCLIDGKVAIPDPQSISTHILKPAIHNYPDSVENEYFCLKLAERMGFKIPAVMIRYAEGMPYLLIERYDRKPVGNNRIMRIHQEDFCQALGIPSSNKYESEGGPRLKDCFSLVAQFSTPAKEITEFLQRVIFNYLIGNHDGHGKNFSLLHLASKKLTLTPVYDVMCTRVYPDLSTKMAMKIGGHYEAEKILPRYWQKLCQEIGFSWPGFLKRFASSCEKILPAAELEYKTLQKQGVHLGIIQKILDHLHQAVAKIHT